MSLQLSEADWQAAKLRAAHLQRHQLQVQTYHVVAVRFVVGNGTETDPARHRTEYWTVEGEFLAARDPWLEREQPAP